MNEGLRLAAALAVALASSAACGRSAKVRPEPAPAGSSASAAPQRLVEHRLEQAPLAFDRDFVQLELDFGDRRSAEIRVVGAKASEARLSLTSPAAGFDVDVLAPRGDAGEGVRFGVRGEAAGVHVGRVTFATGLADPAELAVNYTWKVTGTLEVDPTTPYINLNRTGPKTVAIDVRSSQPNFEIRAVEVRQGPFSAAFEKVGEGGHYRIDVSVRDRELAPDLRGVSGKLVIVSNDLTEPQKELPLLGIGTPGP